MTDGNDLIRLFLDNNKFALCKNKNFHAINTTAFKCDNIILSQDRIPLLGGVRGGFLLETQIIKITNNAHQVNTNVSHKAQKEICLNDPGVGGVWK